jgi:hypothetical protein
MKYKQLPNYDKKVSSLKAIGLDESHFPQYFEVCKWCVEENLK